VKFTDTQRRLLAAASQRDDRALERPSNLTGGAAGKAVAKLLAEGLVEENQSRGSLPVWRRDGDVAHTLRITKTGVRAIRADDEATGAGELAKKPPAVGEIAQVRSTIRRPHNARLFQASQRGHTAVPPARNDDRGNHESDGVAAAFRARLLRRRGPQEAGTDAGVGEGRGRTRLSDRLA
jgi:hypothetical protein